MGGLPAKPADRATNRSTRAISKIATGNIHSGVICARIKLEVCRRGTHQHHLGPPDALLRAVPIGDDRRQVVFELPTTTLLLDRLRIDGRLRRLCGWERADELPSEATFSRAFAEFEPRPPSVAKSRAAWHDSRPRRSPPYSPICRAPVVSARSRMPRVITRSGVVTSCRATWRMAASRSAGS